MIAHPGPCIVEPCPICGSTSRNWAEDLKAFIGTWIRTTCKGVRFRYQAHPGPNSSAQQNKTSLTEISTSDRRMKIRLSTVWKHDIVEPRLHVFVSLAWRSRVRRHELWK
eukprot:1179253-Amphidinium_carterae.1